MKRQIGTKSSSLQRQIEVLQTKSSTDNISIAYLANLVTHLNRDLVFSRNQLTLILGSSRWAMGGIFSAILRIIRLNSLVERVYRRLRKSQDSNAHSMIATEADLPPQIEIPVVYDIYPYKNLQLLKDIKVEVVNENFAPEYCDTSFSIATPVWNEEDGIINFLKSIQAQSLKPDEVVLTDGGSTDNTVKLIEDFAKIADFDIIVIKEKRIPIATGRNLAIKKARNEIIVMADAGTLLHKDTCLNLVSCFKKYGNPELVGGIWLPIEPSEYAKAFVPDWEAIDWNRWLTSTRSMAIRKTLVKKAGYFPEHIFYGDDTLFGVKYRRISNKWVFNKKAITYWDAPSTHAQYEKTSKNYGRGDGENGLCEYFYPSNLLHSTKTDLPIKASPVRKEFLEGYLEGRLNRGRIEIDLRKIKGVVIFLTTIPFYENEHSRIFKEIIKSISNNYKAICVNFYPNLDSLFPKKYLNIDYTLLELYYVDDFDVKEFLTRYPQKEVQIKVVMEDKNPRFNRVLVDLARHKIKAAKILPA